jgi:dihydroorotate dehydrogenase electron transfer subunit
VSGCLGSMSKVIIPARIVANESRGGYYSLKVCLGAAEGELKLKPGQFIELGLGQSDLVLRRPFSVFQAKGCELEILYQVVGEGTRRLRDMSMGTELSVMGPLGNCWPIPDESEAAGQRVLLLAGGIGAAPLAMLAEELLARDVRVKLILAARGRDWLCEYEWFQRLLPSDGLMVATDDGSVGVAGMITGPLDLVLQRDPSYDCAYICGPEPMMAACARRCNEEGLASWVSMERLMACGVGACLSCVAPTTKGLQRVCADGPVFAAKEVMWDEARASRVR